MYICTSVSVSFETMLRPRLHSGYVQQWFVDEAAPTNQHLLHGITVINGLKAINKPPTAGVYILKVVLRVHRQ